jgi:2-keto-4-pentenoate hydratase/2-oxohepta-3-ene-1,7-dioic acid hydratase in catechol pathway
MQDASSRDMYFTIPEQIEYLSELFTLLPGDVIGTGTPPGVGHARGVYLKPGDAVSITIEGLGSMRNPVVAGGEIPSQNKGEQAALASSYASTTNDGPRG